MDFDRVGLEGVKWDLVPGFSIDKKIIIAKLCSKEREQSPVTTHLILNEGDVNIDWFTFYQLGQLFDDFIFGQQIHRVTADQAPAFSIIGEEKSEEGVYA
jgi:hypothetical protein